MKRNFRSLNEIITFRGGGTPRKDVPEYWSDEIPWASVKDFKSLDLSRTQDSISRKGLAASASNLIPAGHVIIPTRMALGKAAINSIDMAINQDLRALIPKVPLDSRYLLHSMIGLADEIVRYGSGATVKGITQDNLGKLQIPLPPLAEQKRIAAILDAADALRTKRREALAQLDALLQSSFLTLFGDPVSNPMGWKKSTIGELVDNIDSGWSPTCLERPAADGEWGVLKLGAVTYCVYREDQTKALPPGLTPRPEIEVQKGDLLFVRKNTYELVAACAYVHKTRSRLMLPDLIFRLRLSKAAKTEPIFMWQQLIVPHLRKHIQSFAGGAAGSMPNISKAKLRDIQVIKPPLPLQQKFAAIVESIERQKTTQRAHLAELDALFAALQHRAFRGEL